MPNALLDYEANDMTVTISELLVATSDESDSYIDTAVPEVLALLRQKLKMDIVFVSEFADGDLVIKYLDTSGDAPVQLGDSTPLEKTWCQRVIKGRLPAFVANCNEYFETAELLKELPFPIGTFLSTPIVLKNGSIYGTLCCLSYAPVGTADPKDLKRLVYTARMTAEMIDRKRPINS